MTTKDEALKLALEALGAFEKDKRVDYRAWDESKASEAIAAIREALNASLADSALERMAENERELGMDYMEPVPPPECKTDAEKTAFAFGWWKALEENRKQSAQQPLTDGQINLFINGRGEEGDDDYVEPTGDGFGLTDADLVRLVRRVEAAHGIKGDA